MENLQNILKKVTEALVKVYKHTEIAISKISTYKATPSMVEDTVIDYHDILTPIKQIATINTPDASTIHITPWEKKLLYKIEKAIAKNNQQDFSPQNTGKIIKIILPPLTEERRLKLVKKVDIEIENSKVRIRRERKLGNDHFKELKKEGISKDEVKKGKDALEKLIKEYIKKIEDLQKNKTKDLMKV